MMSEHKHTTLIEDCYRCDLNRDEIKDALADAAEPDATDEDFKIEPISQHTLKVPVQYKGQAEPLDFTEPDARDINASKYDINAT